MGVEPSHGHGDALGKAQLLRPALGEAARRAVGGVGLLVEAVPQVRQLRIETGEERLIPLGLSTPARRAGTKSASSTQLAAASKTSGATLRQRQTFDQNHSDE